MTVLRLVGDLPHPPEGAPRVLPIVERSGSIVRVNHTNAVSYEPLILIRFVENYNTASELEAAIDSVIGGRP